MLFKKKSVKIYLSHTAFQEIPGPRKRPGAPNGWAAWQNPVMILSRFLGRQLFALSFFTGRFLLQTSKLTRPALSAAFTAAGTAVNFCQSAIWRLKQKVGFLQKCAREKKPRNSQTQSKFSLALFLFLSLAAASWFAANRLAGSSLALKGRVLSATDNALGHLEQAKASLLSQNAEIAQSQFSQAYLGFVQGLDDLNQAGGLIKTLVGVWPQTRSAQAILTAAALSSQAGVSLSQFAEAVKNLKFTSAGVVGTDDLARDFGQMQEFLNSGSSNLKQALELLAQVKAESLPEPLGAKLLQAEGQLSALNAALPGVSNLFNLAEKLLLGQKNLLFLLENNNELRASGGFIGTYGAAKINRGQLLNLQINSIYDLDGQLKQVILPPQPLLAVNQRWYMRDSNWFADFPQSAKKLSDFYEKEGGETPDLIVALTPSLITKLLSLTGPVKLPAYNLTLDADNFVENVQAATSVNYDKNLNSPKQLLADFVPALFDRLQKLEGEGKNQLIGAILENLEAKQIIFYSRQPQIQSLLSEFNWTGAVRPAPKDYLAVYSSNLGGTKTDLFIDQQMGLKTQIFPDGEIINTLTLTAKNNLPRLPQTKNLSYLRFLVPKGSQLLASTGFSPQTLARPETAAAKIDADVSAWEKTLASEAFSQTRVGEEAGKTFFGNWLEVEGGSAKTVSLRWRLPFKFNGPEAYTLLLQQQPGVKPVKFDYGLAAPGRIFKWTNFAPQGLFAAKLEGSLELKGDKLLGAVIE